MNRSNLLILFHPFSELREERGKARAARFSSINLYYYTFTRQRIKKKEKEGGGGEMPYRIGHYTPFFLVMRERSNNSDKKGGKKGFGSISFFPVQN